MPLKVYLVGAGPGDPELITVKGRRILQQADAVLYDHLANSALLSLAPPHAERLYVGKKKSAHAFSQEEICGLLIERARRGLTVVRLKGGDPFLFGRGGEEAEALADAGIPFEIVPGVTTPLGIAACATSWTGSSACRCSANASWRPAPASRPTRSPRASPRSAPASSSCPLSRSAHPPTARRSTALLPNWTPTIGSSSPAPTACASSWTASMRGRTICASCAPGSAPSARPRAPPS